MNQSYKLFRFCQFLLLVHSGNEVFVLYNEKWIKPPDDYNWSFEQYKSGLYKLTPMKVKYNQHIDPEGELLTREDYIKEVETGTITDEKGKGLAVKNDTQSSTWEKHIHPREIEILPIDCTHVVWYGY